MKLDERDSGKDATMNQAQQATPRRDKSVDIRDAKERVKQEKLQKEKEKKEKEKQEKERKEREKREKERLEKEKKMQKKTGQSGMSPGPSLSISAPTNPVSSSATSSALNKLIKSSDNSNMPNSKSENVLSKFRKQNNDPKASSRKMDATNMQLQQNKVSKDRYRCQVVYLDETVKTFDIDVNISFYFLI